jgi:hypothetical protein
MQTIDHDLVRLDSVPAGKPLDGVIGDDPRAAASQDWGAQLKSAIVDRTAGLTLRMLREASALERRQYIEALKAAVRVLAAIRALRAAQPRSAVPPITTPVYLSHCAALACGDFVGAKAAAEAKLEDLFS